MIAGVSITTLLLVLVAGIGAGFVGYAVGASSLISYPALLAFGIPPVLSNTTNTVGVCGTGIGGLLSAIAQGRVAAGSINILAKKPDDWSKGMIFCITVEFYAILCLLASFLMLNGLK